MFHYGVDLRDVVLGGSFYRPGLSPSLVLALIQRLPDTSLTHALASGGREHFGWGIDRYLAANTYDAINQTTRAAGNWGKKGAPDIAPYPRPAGVKSGKKKPTSVKDIFKRFGGFGGQR